MTRNILLKVAYDGTNYAGWQVQANQRTVQGEIQRAAKLIYGQDCPLTGSGRTDAGVHAIAQMANIKINTKMTLEKIPKALNSQLDFDISIIGAIEVAPSFNARKDAAKKQYTYLVSCDYRSNPLLAGKVWAYGYHIDILKMAKAVEPLVGCRDFCAFMSTGSSIKTTIRTIYSIDISEWMGMVRIDVCADGFLYNMVRIITGTIVHSASGRLAPDAASQMLDTGIRDAGGPTAPAHGLYLAHVYYDNKKHNIPADFC
ncbi:MAG: tRNA pseudouridine(38-40) synthase TruA [Eubacteriaceae bacterium]|nr:tRNA pseudouridine(38-40) synthase TruA [Eubacteriaceae bacterium]